MAGGIVGAWSKVLAAEPHIASGEAAGNPTPHSLRGFDARFWRPCHQNFIPRRQLRRVKDYVRAINIQFSFHLIEFENE